MQVLLAIRASADLDTARISEQFISGWKSISSEDSFFTRIFSDDSADPDLRESLRDKGIEIWDSPVPGRNSFVVFENWGNTLVSLQNSYIKSKQSKKIWIGGITPALFPGYPELSKNQIENILIQLIIAPLAFLNGVCQGCKCGAKPLDLVAMVAEIKVFLQSEDEQAESQLSDFWQRIINFLDSSQSVLAGINKSNTTILLPNSTENIDLSQLWTALEKHSATMKAFSLYEKIQRLISRKEIKIQLPFIGQTGVKRHFSLPEKEIAGWGVARLLVNLGLDFSTFKTAICEEIDNLLKTDKSPDLIVCNADSLGIWDYPDSLFESLVEVAGRYAIPVILWGSDLEFTRRDIMEMGLSGVYKLTSDNQRFIDAGMRTASTWAKKTVS